MCNVKAFNYHSELAAEKRISSDDEAAAYSFHVTRIYQFLMICLISMYPASESTLMITA